MSHSLHAHVVFTPGYGRGFTGELPHRCEQIMIDECDTFRAEPAEFNDEHDRVRLLVHYPPKVALSRLLNGLKGVPARLPLARAC